MKERGERSEFAHSRRCLLVAAGICALYLPVDASHAQGRVIVAWRLAWMAALLLAAWFQSPSWPWRSRALVHGAATVSGVATVAILRAAGGSAGPAFGFMLALPLVVLVLAPDTPWAAALAGVATTAGGIFIFVEEGRTVADVGEWAMISLALSALAVVGALGFRRIWFAELRAERERAEAFERLVDCQP